MFSRIFSRNASSSKARNRRSAKSRLGLESLEDRRVLAATNLGAIQGTVFVDNDGNGSFTAGEEVPNALIQLYEDSNNNNSLDVGTDTLVDTATTDGAGDYVFSGLGSGNYFVFQPNQTPAGGVALPQQVSPRKTINGGGNLTTLIDDFDTDTGPVTDLFPPGTPAIGDFAAGTALGGNREFTADFVDGIDGDEVEILTQTSRLLMRTDIDAQGDYTVIWDGAAGGFDATGLGGIDLTASDGNGICIEDILVDEPNGTLILRVYSNATDFSEVTVSLTEDSEVDLFFPFSGTGGDAQFTTAGGAGADFSNVGAIELLITAEEFAMDGRIENIAVFGTDSITCDFLNASPAPTIDVEKFTNGNQADLATDADVPVVAPGSTVTWTYQVTNTGTVDIVTIDLEDDELGSITLADRTGGDTNDDGLLNPGEVWTFERTGIAITGFYDNEARVEGFAASGLSDVDTDTSNYRGAAADIDIEKFTNGNQADLATDADVPQIDAGGSVTWTYQVTNTGSIELNNVQVIDSIEGAITTITNMGNGDATLDVGEVWTFTQSGTALAGAYENSATVTATPIGLAGTVQDTDLSHYFGVQAQIDIEKATNGIDADAVDSGPTVDVGSTVTFTYVVTTSSNTSLTNVVVTDDAGTAGNAADDFNPTFTGGDTDGDSQLDPTESWTYEATGVATLGAYRNVGTVTAQSSTGATVSDTDPSNHRGATPATPLSKRDLLTTAFR